MIDVNTVRNGQDVSGSFGFNIVTGAPTGGVLPIEFYTKRKKAARLADNGEPIWNDVEYCKIYIPGTPVSIIEKVVDEKVQNDFRLQYQSWLLNKSQKMPGLPIEEWPLVQGDEVTELKSKGFHTVESLAQTGETQALMMGQWGLQIREKAIAYLAAIKDSAATAKQAEQFAAAKAENEALRAELEELRAAVKELQQRKKER